MRKDCTYDPPLAQTRRAGLLLVEVCAKVCESKDQTRCRVREGAIMYELWQLIRKIEIGSGRTKTEIIVNQPIYELLVELIKKALKAR